MAPTTPATNGAPRREARRIKAMLMLTLLLGGWSMITACVQDSIVFEKFGTVTVDIDVPEPLTAAGVRVALSGTGELAADNDFAFTDTGGKATIRTRNSGLFSYVVATHEDFEITYGGNADSLRTNFGEQCKNVLFRGRIVVPNPDQKASPRFLFPGSGLAPIVPDPRIEACLGVTQPRRLTLRPKRARLARFVFFLEDNRILKGTFDCERAVPGAKVFVTGSFNEFNFKTTDLDPENGAIELLDDGCLDPNTNSGDDEAGDGVYTRVIVVPPGELSYVYLMNSIPIPFRDPYEERSRRVRVLLPRDDRTGVQEVREFVASVMTVKDEGVPQAERPPVPPPPDPNVPPSSFQ